MKADRQEAGRRLPEVVRRVGYVVGSTGFWAVVGRIVQFFGFGYAIHCLGNANAGVSGQVLALAMMLQVTFSLGMDVVAVRHIAAGTRQVPELLPVIFTSRLALHLGIALIWAAAVIVLAPTQVAVWAWLSGGLYFVVLGMNFQWYYQATGRMVALSRLQTLTTLVVSLVFFLGFRPGQAAGSDIYVLALVHGVVTVGVWVRIRFESADRVLWTRACWNRAVELAREGRAVWLFGLAYNGLTVLGLLLMPLLMGPERGDTESGIFRRSFQPCLALQFILSYLGYIFYPRIVAWRQEVSVGFERRVYGLALAGVALGGLAAVVLLGLGEWLFRIVYRDAEGAGIFPIMVLGKFVGMASGFLVWGILAERRDWLAVWGCVATVAVSGALYGRWIPEHGFWAAGWIYAIGEAMLFLVCAGIFWYVRTTVRRRK